MSLIQPSSELIEHILTSKLAMETQRGIEEEIIAKVSLDVWHEVFGILLHVEDEIFREVCLTLEAQVRNEK